MSGYSLRFSEHITKSLAAYPKSPVLQMAALCIKKNIMLKDAAEAIGVTRPTIYNWCNGLFEPSPKHIQLIKAYISDIKKTQRK